MPPKVHDLASVAKFIMSDSCRSIAVLTGAGVSVAAGIPDFRSPGGMYATLRPDLITATAQQRALMAAEPTAVVMKDMFFANQFPYLEVRRPFILGTREHKWRATLAHRLFELLHTKAGKLTRLYTQNIDGLDYQCAGLPAEKVVAVHGSIGRVACEACGAGVPLDDFCTDVSTRIKDIYGADAAAPDESTNIECKACGRVRARVLAAPPQPEPPLSPVPRGAGFARSRRSSRRRCSSARASPLSSSSARPRTCRRSICSSWRALHSWSARRTGSSLR